MNLSSGRPATLRELLLSVIQVPFILLVVVWLAVIYLGLNVVAILSGQGYVVPKQAKLRGDSIFAWRRFKSNDGAIWCRPRVVLPSFYVLLVFGLPSIGTSIGSLLATIQALLAVVWHEVVPMVAGCIIVAAFIFAVAEALPFPEDN